MPIFLEINQQFFKTKIERFNKYIITREDKNIKIKVKQFNNDFILSILDMRTNIETKIEGGDTITILGNTIWENLRTANQSQDILTRALDQLRDRRLKRLGMKK